MGVPAGGLDARPLETSYEKLISKTFLMATEWLGKNSSRSDAIVLAPCGSSRAELLRRLLERGQHISKAYVYKGFKEKLEYLGQEVEEFENLDELARELKSRKEGLVVVVPESSFDAVMLKQVLPKARVKLLYLPSLYSRATKELNWPSKDVKRLARVEHTWLGKAYKWRRSAKGCSSTLLRDWKKEELEELKKAKKAILALSPGRLGLGDYLAETLGKMIFALAAAPFGVAVALAVEQLLAPLASLNIHEAAQMLLNKVGSIPARYAEGFASRVLEGWSRPEARNKVAEGLAKLIAAAREAAPHLGREELEAVVDQVALEWGMDAPTFKVFVRNLAKLASGELVTREELSKELEKLVGKELEERLKRLIENRLREIEGELNRLKDKVEARAIGVKLFYADDLEKSRLYYNFKVEKGRPVIGSLEEKGKVEAELVTVGSFERLAGEVLRRLEGGFVVLEGSKGIGKSTLAAYTAWLALLNGQVDAILSVSKLDRGEASGLENLVGGAGKRFLVLYDPSPLHAYYEPGAYAHEVREAFERSSVGSFLVEETLRGLLKLRGVGRVSVLVVLPDDIYRSVIERNPELKGELERYTLRVDLRDPLFLEEVIKAYSGCTGSFKELAESIAKFEDGYMLVAKYAGLTLREKGYSVEDVQTAIDEAKGKPKLFLAYYLWSVLLKGSGDLAIMAAAPLILHSLFGPIPEGVTYLVKAALEGGRWRLPDPERLKGVKLGSLKVDELKPLARWLSVWHEDLVEEMLKELCRLEYRELEELTGALEWAWSEILREEEKVPVPEWLPDFVGKRLEVALEAYATNCWRRLALIAGIALTAPPLIPLTEVGASRFMSEALKPCEADSYLLVSNGIPLLVVNVVLRRPNVLAHPLARWHREVAEEIKQLEDTWRNRGRMYLIEMFYGLGLALAVAGAVELGESVEAWEAEVALYNAVPAVHQVFKVECAATILNSFRRLGELAPHFFISFVFAASELRELERGVAREMAIILEEVLEKHWKELKKKGWPLVKAVRAYSNLLINHRGHFRGEEERLRVRMCELLEELEGQLRDIAEVYAVETAFYDLEPCNGTDPADRAEVLLKRLEEMEKEKPSEQATEWATEQALKPEFKRLVRDLRGTLTYSLAMYKMENNELEAARELYRRSAEIAKELKHWEHYLTSCSLAERCRVLGAGSLEELRGRARAFEGLWSKAKKRQNLIKHYLEAESKALAEYLVFIALEDRKDEISELLEREKWLLRLFPKIGVTTRLILKLLGVKVEKPEAWEVAVALGSRVYAELQPAFNTLMGRSRDALNKCDKLIGEKRENCHIAVNAVNGDKDAITELRLRSINMLSHILNVLLRGDIVQDFEEKRFVQIFYRELLDFVDRRNVSALIQLVAPLASDARFPLMLWALVNGDEELARAHAKLGAMSHKKKLLRRLFREAAIAQGDELKLALLKLFYYHI